MRRVAQVDHLGDMRQHGLQRDAQAVARGRRRVRVEMRDRAGGVGRLRLRILQHIAIVLLPARGRLRRAMRDHEHAPFRAFHMAVIGGEAAQALGAAQQSVEHAHRIPEQIRIGRRRHDGRIHAHRPRGLDRTRRRTRHQLVIEGGQRLGAHAPQRRGERGLGRRRHQRADPTERAVRHRVGEMKRQLRIRPARQLAHEQAAQRLLPREPRATRGRILSAARLEVFLNACAQRRLCIEHGAHSDQIGGMRMRDPRRGER